MSRIETNAKKNVKTKLRRRLFTPVMRAYIGKGLKMGQYFQMHPYVWNSKTGGESVPEYVGDPTKVTYSRWRLYLWHFNMVLTFAYSAFVSVRCYQTNQDEGKTNSQKVYMKFVTVYFLFPSGLQLVAYFDGPEFPVFTKGFMKFYEDFERKYFTQYSDAEKARKLIMVRICEFLMINCYRCINCITCMMVIGCYLRPDSPEHLSSLMSDPKSLSLLQKIPFMVFLGYFEVMFHTHCFVLLLVGLGFVIPALVCLKELNKEITCVKITSLENFRGMFHTYNAIRILVIYFNGIFSPLALPVYKLSLIMFTVMCTYCGIRMEGLVAHTLGFLGFYSFLLLLMAFGLFSEFHTRTSAMLESLKSLGFVFGVGSGLRMRAQNPVDYKCHQRIVKSMRPMTIVLRSFYKVDKGMVVTMVDGVVDQTVTFLLANP